jgi:hypothetical protein
LESTCFHRAIITITRSSEVKSEDVGTSNKLQANPLVLWTSARGSGLLLYDIIQSRGRKLYQASLRGEVAL